MAFCAKQTLKLS
ncbi:hypothetical protein D047_2973A, partial [Vibrio parahaemolyticus VPTS-2010_2]